MSYATILAQAFSKKQRWLYSITYGGTTYRRASATVDITRASQTFDASTIMHTRITTSRSLTRQEVVISIPRTDAIASAMSEGLLGADSEVVIRRTFADDPDSEAPILFRGKIAGRRTAWTRFHILAESGLTALGDKGLPSTMQRPCRHGIYSAECGVVLADFQTAGTITSLVDSTATIAAAAGEADGYYTGGILEWSGKRQMIRAHSGNQVTLLGPIAGLATAQSSSNQAVDIAPGCDLTRAICNDRFDNLSRHGGFSWMTGNTPYDGRTLY